MVICLESRTYGNIFLLLVGFVDLKGKQPVRVVVEVHGGDFSRLFPNKRSRLCWRNHTD